MRLMKAAVRGLSEQQAASVGKKKRANTLTLKITQTLWENWVLTRLRDFLKIRCFKQHHSFIHLLVHSTRMS